MDDVRETINAVEIASTWRIDLGIHDREGILERVIEAAVQVSGQDGLLALAFEDLQEIVASDMLHGEAVAPELLRLAELIVYMQEHEGSLISACWRRMIERVRIEQGEIGEIRVRYLLDAYHALSKKEIASVLQGTGNLETELEPIQTYLESIRSIMLGRETTRWEEGLYDAADILTVLSAVDKDMERLFRGIVDLLPKLKEASIAELQQRVISRPEYLRLAPELRDAILAYFLRERERNMSVVIVTDSMILPEGAQVGARVLPYRVTVSEKASGAAQTYSDGQITEEVLAAVGDTKHFELSTGALGAEAAVTAFASCARNKPAIAVVIPRKLSLSHNALVTGTEARNETYPDSTLIFDADTVGVGARLLVMAAVEAAHRGQTPEEIMDLLRDLRSRLHAYGLPGSMRRLLQGGRLGKPGQVMDRLLGRWIDRNKVNIIATVEEGDRKIEKIFLPNNRLLRGLAAGLSRGIGHEAPIEFTEEDTNLDRILLSHLPIEVDPSCPVILEHFGAAPERVAAVAADLGERYPKAEILVQEAAISYGAHLGVGTMTVVAVADSIGLID